MKRAILIGTVLSVLVVLVAFPGAFAEHSKRFNGSMSGSSSATSQFTNDITATGRLSRLGKMTLVGVTTVSGFSDCGGFVGTEQDTISVRHGDTISIAGNGTSCPGSDPNVFEDTVTFTITGGTGRFADASGSGTIQTTIVVTSPTSSTFTATITGTITF